MHKAYSTGTLRTEVLRGVNLHVEKGEFVVILGPSGSGKTTLLYLVGALDKPDRGHIVFDEKKLSDLDENGLADFRMKRIGFVFQFYNLLPTLTALENVMLAIEPVVEDSRRCRAQATKWLDAVGLRGKANDYTAHLSGGEQQRVSIARALAKVPTVLLADEPTGNLDSDTADRIIQLMKNLNQKTGITFIVVSHNPNFAEVANTTYTLYSGRLQRAES